MGIRLVVIFLCCLLSCVSAAAANIPLMPIKDLQPGMEGVGRTVIQGDKIEEFKVEILGVSGSETAGQSIFVRLYGDLIDKTGGVAQGMSGSPVFVDGRLVGAVAYGRQFNDPHYCFLTPIHSMLQLLDEPDTEYVSWISENDGEGASVNSALSQGTPLLVSGFSTAGLDYLQQQLEPMGLQVLGAGGQGGPMPSGALEPGSAVGAAMMQGDMTVGALGTVTWTDDEGNVLAFGHPFMQRGASNLLMTKVWVLGCIPNLQSSYKVGNLGQSIGSFTQDRGAGIRGQVGALPQLVPVFVQVQDLQRQQQQSLRVQVVKDEKLLPALADAALANGVSRALDRNGGGTAKLSFSLTGRYGAKQELLEIKRENMYYSSSSLPSVMNLELAETLRLLMQNKFEQVDLYDIQLQAQVTDEVRIAEITKVASRGRYIAPGESIEIKVTLKPYRGAEFDRIVSFKLPKDYPEGPLSLNVRGGSSMAWVQKLLRKQREDEDAPRKEQERKLADFIKSINRADQNNDLIVDLAKPMGKEPHNGEGAVGASLERLLQGSPLKQKQSFDFIIDGERELLLEVRRAK